MKVRNIAKVLFIACLIVSGLVFNGCASGGAGTKDNNVAATVNGRNILLSEVERAINQQMRGNPTPLNQLQLATARLQVLDTLIQREVMFQRAEREKVLPTDQQIEGAIAGQRQNSGLTSEEFDKRLKEQNMSIESLREQARKELAIAALQDKYNGKILINDREVEEYYTSNRSLFRAERGVALAMIAVDPADNSATGIKDDAKNEADAKLKIDNIYQQLQGGADFATVARAKSEDINSLQGGGDIGFATEDDLRQNSFPAELVSNLFGSMQVGDYTPPVSFRNKWYIFKLAERRLAAENLTLESPGVRQQITQALTNQRKQLLNAALMEVAVNEARIVNNLASQMLNNPSNLGLRPAAEGAAASPQATTPAETQTPQPSATSPAATSSPVTVRPGANSNK